MTITPLTFYARVPPAKTLASPDFVQALMETEEILPYNLFTWLYGSVPAGWYGKMSQESSLLTEDWLSDLSSRSWGNAGMGSPTEFLTLSISEFPSAGAASSLSDILETGDLPPRYFLSPKACAGILRRAEKRGKELPDQLRRALEEATKTMPKTVD